MRYGMLGLCALLALGAGLASAQVAPDATDPRAIMNASYHQDAGDRVVARIRMTIADGEGRERVRVVRSRSMEMAGGRKTILLFESPADVRNTGLLTVDYEDRRREDEQWLYLPSVHRATRIAAAGRSGSFVGSDFTYADLAASNPDDFELRLLAADAPVSGEPCWRIESVPRTPAIRESTGYTRTEVWISKRSLLPIRMKGWMAQDRVKYIALEDVRQVDGIWTAHRIVARTVQSGRVLSQTTLERLEVRYGDASVTDADFSVRRLEQGL